MTQRDQPIREQAIGPDGLTRRDRDIIRDVLARYPEVRRVTLFGSRAMSTFGRGSDIDLALEGPDLNPRTLTRIATELEDSDLPYKVDLLLRDDQLEPKLEAHIRQCGKPFGWEETTLGDIVKRGGGSIQTGPFGSQLHASDYVPIGVPSIMPTNIGDNRLIREGIACITEEDAQRLSQHIVRKDDIIYSRRGDVERRALVREEEDGWFCGTGCLKVRLGDGVVVPEFASYYLGHPEVRQWIVRHAIGATMPNLNTSIMAAVPFLLPPIDEQRAIAGVLGALDDKIEQNRRTAGALERLARATFRAWFVDFDPVKAKAEGATAFPSMPQPVFDALPTRFTDSAIGPVPEGWEVKVIGEVVQLTMGQSPKSEFYNQNGEGLPFHQGVSDHGFRFPTRRVHCTVEGRIAEEGDIRLSVRAPVGRINVADVKMVLGRGLAGMRHLSGRQSFLLYQMQHLFAEDDAVGDGTIYKSVNKKYLQAMPLLVAPMDIEEAFEHIARPMDKLISSVVLESSKLAEMRDYLLPKLLSRQVRVQVAHG